MSVNIYQVASAAGVSITTVSRAVNGVGRVSPRTRARVLAVARDLDYIPNDAARSLITRTSHTIAVLLPDLTNPFFPELIAGVEAVARQNRHFIILCDSAESPQGMWRDLVSLRRRQVAGVVLVGASLPEDRLAAVTKGLRIVTVDRSSSLPGVSVVQTDHQAGGALVARHLADLGHRRVLHLRGPEGIAVAGDRWQGFEREARRLGLDVGGALLRPAGFSEREGYHAMSAALDEGLTATAVFAANDLCAIGAMSALHNRGLSVPDDVSLVGFDGITLGEYLRPSLTTVQQDIRALGERAAAILLAELALPPGVPAEPILEVHPPTMACRASSGPAKSGVAR